MKNPNPDAEGFVPCAEDQQRDRKYEMRAEIERHLAGVDPFDIDQVDRAAQAIRIRIRSHKLPAEVEAAIRTAYAKMGDNMPVAVRSSAPRTTVFAASAVCCPTSALALSFAAFFAA